MLDKIFFNSLRNVFAQPAVWLAAFFAVFLILPAHAVEFPYFGPISDTELYIYSGFLHGWNLFKQISDPNGVLFYLALSGGLIGAVQIFVSAKNQTLGVLSGWFVIILLLLIAPVSSQLLFTEIENDTLPDDSEVKAFTPQVVGMHVISVVHEALLSYFTSNGYNDAIDAALAHQALQNNIEMDDDAFESAKEFLNDPACRETAIQPRDLQQALNNDSGTATEASGITYADALKKIEDYYRNVQGNTTTPPPAVALYTNESQLPQSLRTDEGKAGYLAGIKQLCLELYSRSEGEAKCGGNISAVSSAIFTSEQYTAGKSLCGGNARYCDPSIGLSFVITPFGQSGTPAELARRSYQDVNGGSVARNFTNASAYDAGLGPLKKVLNSNNVRGAFSLLAKTPVVTAYQVNESSLEGANDCETRANNTADTLIRSVLGNPSTANPNQLLFSTEFTEMLLGQRSWPSGKLTLDQVKNPAGVNTGSRLPEQLVAYYNTNIANNTEMNNAQKRARFLDRTLGMAYNNKQQANIRANRSDREEAALDPTTIGGLWRSNNGGTNGIAKGVAWLGFTITDGLTRVVANVAGLIAKIFIKFLMVFVDMTLMAILVLTPLVLIMGLVVPSYSVGVLTLVTLSVFILKMVPLTFLIINQTTSLLYSILGTMSEGGFLDDFLGTFEQSILVIAAAVMYLSVVGITLFILFKIGDPSNVAQLAALDSAAKSMAKAGMALGIGALTGGAVGLAGARKAAATKGEDRKKEKLGNLDQQIADLEKKGMYMSGQDIDKHKALTSERDALAATSNMDNFSLTEDGLGAVGAGAFTGAWQTGEAFAGIASTMLPGTGYGAREVFNAFSEGSAQASAVAQRGIGGHLADRFNADSAKYRAQESSRIAAAKGYTEGSAVDDMLIAADTGEDAAGEARGTAAALRQIGASGISFDGATAQNARAKVLSGAMASREAAKNIKGWTAEDFLREAEVNEANKFNKRELTRMSNTGGTATSIADGMSKNDKIKSEILNDANNKGEIRKYMKSELGQAELVTENQKGLEKAEKEVSGAINAELNTKEGLAEVSAKAAELKGNMQTKLDGFNEAIKDGKFTGVELKDVNASVENLKKAIADDDGLFIQARAELRSAKVSEALKEREASIGREAYRTVRNNQKETLVRRVLEDEAHTLMNGGKSQYNSINSYVGSNGGAGKVITSGRADFLKRASTGGTLAHGIAEGQKAYHSADIDDTLELGGPNAANLRGNTFKGKDGKKKKLTAGMMKDMTMWTASAKEASGWRADAMIGAVAGLTDWDHKVRLTAAGARNDYVKVETQGRLQNIKGQRIETTYQQVVADQEIKLSAAASADKLANPGVIRAMAATKAKMRAEMETNLIVKSTQGGKANKAVKFNRGFGEEEFDGPRDELAGHIKSIYEQKARKAMAELQKKGGGSKNLSFGKGLNMKITADMSFEEIAQSAGILSERAIGAATLTFKQITGQRFINPEHRLKKDGANTHGYFTLGANITQMKDVLGWSDEVIAEIAGGQGGFMKKSSNGNVEFKSGAKNFSEAKIRELEGGAPAASTMAARGPHQPYAPKGNVQRAQKVKSTRKGRKS